MNEARDAEKRLLDFARRQRRLFLYGAGKYGKLCLKYLQRGGIACAGFIQTERSMAAYAGLPVFSWAELQEEWAVEDGIVLAMNPFFQREIMAALAGVSVYGISEQDFYALGSQSLAEEMERLLPEAAKEAPLPPSMWQKILVVRLDVVGDMIWTSAFLRELRRNFPKAEIALVLRPAVRPLMEHCPYVDALIPYDCPLDHVDYDAAAKEIRAAVRAFAAEHLRPRSFDAVFLPRWLEQGDIIENLYLAVFCGARARIASVETAMPGAEWFIPQAKRLFSSLATNLVGKHEVQRALELLRILNLAVQDDRMEVWLAPREQEDARALLREAGGKEAGTLIAVGLVGRRAYRTWDAESYGRFFQKAAEHFGQRVRFLLLGGEDARGAERAALQAAGAAGNCISLVGRTSLLEAAAVIEAAAGYIGSNTGLLHMAAALKKPVLEISADLPDGDGNNPVSPEKTGAWRTPCVVVRPPRGLDGCTGYCRSSGAHCINQIGADEVMRAFLQLMGPDGKGGGGAPW